jgi:hypothetical protein
MLIFMLRSFYYKNRKCFTTSQFKKNYKKEGLHDEAFYMKGESSYSSFPIEFSNKQHTNY